MLLIDSTSTIPYFNIATEEFILKEFTEDCFLLYRNAPSIIVGKNQNTLEEVNIDYIKKHSIPVVRRLSGGGAVFHDLGNLNFSFILNSQDGDFSNYHKFTQPIIEVLKQLSVHAELSGRNDITIDGKKISGNAQYAHKGKLIHHGTLLFATEMSDLTNALKVNPLKIQSKGIKSIRKRVTNISEYLKSPLSIEQFKNKIIQHILNTYSDTSLYTLSQQDIEKINKLVEEKYGTWDWNYGYSPKYNFKKISYFPAGTVEIHLDVRNGIIEKAKIYGDFFGKYDVSEVEGILIGVRHKVEDIRNVLASLNIDNYFSNISLDDLIHCLF